VIKLFTDIKNLAVKWFNQLNTRWKEYRYGKDI
jgi:branched-chain amino acid transport system permease protein